MAASDNPSTSNTPIMLLALNLIATIALLAHVVYYIPGNRSANVDPAITADQTPSALSIDGVGDVGMGAQGVALDLIQLGPNSPAGQPEVVQTLNMSQEAFLNTLQRMTILRDRLIEKDLIQPIKATNGSK